MSTGLVALFELLEGKLLLRVGRSFSLPLFLEMRFTFPLVLKPDKKIRWCSASNDFAEFRAAGSSLLHNESEKYTWASISASKNVFRKSLKKNQPVCGTQPHPDKRVGPVAGFPPQRLRCLDACLHRTMEKHMQ